MLDAFSSVKRVANVASFFVDQVKNGQCDNIDSTIALLERYLKEGKEEGYVLTSQDWASIGVEGGVEGLKEIHKQRMQEKSVKVLEQIPTLV